MPSFTSLVSFASLAFAAMASTLPHSVGPSTPGSDIGVDVKARRDLPDLAGIISGFSHHSKRADLELIEVEILTAIANTFGVQVKELVKVVANTVGVLNGPNVDLLNAISHQSRELAEVEPATNALNTVGLDAKNAVSVFDNVVGAGNNANVDGGNAKSIQRREVLDKKSYTAIAAYLKVDVGSVLKVAHNVLGGKRSGKQGVQNREYHDHELIPYHIDIISAIATYANIDVADVLDIINNKVSVLDNLHIEAANAKAIQSRHNAHVDHLLPGDVAIITTIATFLNLDIDDLLNVVDNKIEVLPNAQIELLNAKAVQSKRSFIGDLSPRQDEDEEDCEDEPEKRSFAPLSVLSTLGGKGLKSRTETRTLPVIILDLTARVQPVCDHIRHIVSLNLDAAATLDLAIPVLDELKLVVLDVKAEIDFLVAHPIEGVLVLKGKVLSIHVFAELVATALTTIIVALGLVAKIAATVKTEVAIALIIEIGAALAVIVGGSLHLVAGLLVEITPLVDCIAPIILELNLGALIQVLKLTVSAA